MRWLRSRWLAPALHTVVFGIMCLTAWLQPQALLDGPARFAFTALFVTDFPVSVIGASAVWDGRLLFGLSLWEVLGSAWWYLLGVGLQRLRSPARES